MLPRPADINEYFFSEDWCKQIKEYMVRNGLCFVGV